ncbi:MAG: hypothetical protein M3R27_13190 [Bacteroidota bacterium]|nr:hypothetical protein [Bacteroidota bacterium]
MKNIFLLLALLLFGSRMNAQNSNIEIDPHIYTHYSPEQIQVMKETAPLELKKLNHYFKNSFIIVPADGSISKGPKPELFNIDVKRFEDQRMDDSRKPIIISANNDQLILKSKKELEEEYKKIN